MNRRGLLRGILAAGMAPVIVKAEILMPVKTIVNPYPWIEPWYAPAGLMRGKTKSFQTIDEVAWHDGGESKTITLPDSLFMTGELGVIYGMAIITDEYKKPTALGRVNIKRMFDQIKKQPKKNLPMFVHAESWRDLAKRYHE